MGNAACPKPIVPASGRPPLRAPAGARLPTGRAAVRLDWREIGIWIWRGLGGAVAVGGMEIAADLGETPLALVPFATSIVVVMGMPEASPAQPRALVGGHLVSALCGLAMLWLFGPSQVVAAAAVGVAMVAMRLTGTMHPPAAINPIIVVIEQLPPSFLLVPIGAGAVLLALFAVLWHNVPRRGSWPRRWS